MVRSRRRHRQFCGDFFLLVFSEKMRVITQVLGNETLSTKKCYRAEKYIIKIQIYLLWFECYVLCRLNPSHSIYGLKIYCENKYVQVIT